jgi:hypothetical protein
MKKSQSGKFWRRNPRPTEEHNYSPSELWDKAMAYFDWCYHEDMVVIEFYGKDAIECEVPKMRAPSIQGVRNFTGLTPTQLDELKNNPDYEAVIAMIYDVIFQYSIEGAESGQLNPNIVASKLGLAKKTEQINENKESVVIYLPSNGRLIENKPLPKITLPTKTYQEAIISELDED